jgi:hypothetical protein
MRKSTELATERPSAWRGGSIRGWCDHRGFCPATFYKMKRNGVAPKVTELPGMQPYITEHADREWEAAVNNLDGEVAAKAARDAEERRGRAVAAASKAIASPKHITNKDRAA